MGHKRESGSQALRPTQNLGDMLLLHYLLISTYKGHAFKNYHVHKWCQEVAALGSSCKANTFFPKVKYGVIDSHEHISQNPAFTQVHVIYLDFSLSCWVKNPPDSIYVFVFGCSIWTLFPYCYNILEAFSVDRCMPDVHNFSSLRVITNTTHTCNTNINHIDTNVYQRGSAGSGTSSAIKPLTHTASAPALNFRIYCSDHTNPSNYNPE
jgi:hypothetical protein